MGSGPLFGGKKCRLCLLLPLFMTKLLDRFSQRRGGINDEHHFCGKPLAIERRCVEDTGDEDVVIHGEAGYSLVTESGCRIEVQEKLAKAFGQRCWHLIQTTEHRLDEDTIFVGMRNDMANHILAIKGEAGQIFTGRDVKLGGSDQTLDEGGKIFGCHNKEIYPQFLSTYKDKFPLSISEVFVILRGSSRSLKKGVLKKN